MGSEPSTLMAIIRQESSFDPNAAPDREKILGIIPWKRPSSARGYSQAVDATWDQYKKKRETIALVEVVLKVL